MRKKRKKQAPWWKPLNKDHCLALNRQGFVPMPGDECSLLFRNDYGICELLRPYLKDKKLPTEYVNVREYLAKKLNDENKDDSLLQELLDLPDPQLQRVCVIRAAQQSFRLATTREMQTLREELPENLLKRAESEEARTFKMQRPLYLFDGSGSLLTFTLGALWNGSDAEAVNLSKRLLGLRRKLSQQTYISGFWKRQGDDLLFALTKVFSECLELARARGELDELTRSLLGGLAKDIASYFASPFFKAVVTAFKFCIPRRYFEEEWAAGHHAIEALLRSPEACSTLRHGTHRSAERRSDDASLELRRQLTENYADTFLFELLGATFDADSQAYRLPDDWQARVPIPLVINAYFGLVTSDSKAQRFQDPAHRDGDNVPGSLSLALYHGQFTGGPLSIDLLQDSRLPLIFQPTCGAVGGFRFDALIHHVSTSGVTGQRLTVILFLDRHLNDVAAGRKPFAIARDKNQTRSYLQAPADIDMQTASSASATRKDLDNHVASVRAAFPGPISGGIDVAAAAAAAGAGATPTPRSSPKRKGVVAHNDSPVPLKSPRLGRSQSAHDHQAVVVPRSRSAQFQQVVSVTSQFYSGPGRRR